MPKSNANLALKGLDEMFSTEESRQEQKREQVQQIPIEELFPFKEHPFKVLDDEAMQRTVESVAQYGVLAPLIARPRSEGGYEIISGHRRQHAAELAGLDTLPVIVREMTDDAAVILMVDSNLQRENILPSERAFAYKMKLKALKNQGARSDLTSCQVGTKFRADESLAEDTGESARNVQRFIRLTNLIPELLDLVDEKKISFNPAVELSYLDEAQQRDFLQAIACYELIQMITEHNNMAQFEPALLMKWIFKTAVSVWLISNTFEIIMAVFDVTQQVVANSSGIISGNTRVNEVGLSMLEASMMQMEVGPLFGLFLQSFFIGITMRILSIVIFVIVYGRMIEIYYMVSLAPIPMATWGNHEQSHIGQNYLKSLFALGFQGFLILICVAIYAVLIQNVAISGDAINSIWSIVGYTVLLCFTLFKTSSVAKSILGAH